MWAKQARVAGMNQGTDWFPSMFAHLTLEARDPSLGWAQQSRFTESSE